MRISWDPGSLACLQYLIVLVLGQWVAVRWAAARAFRKLFLKKRRYFRNKIQQVTMETVCIFSKYGNCKYRETCRKQHYDEVYKKESFEKINCAKRHPKTCNFF